MPEAAADNTFVPRQNNNNHKRSLQFAAMRYRYFYCAVYCAATFTLFHSNNHESTATKTRPFFATAFSIQGGNHPSRSSRTTSSTKPTATSQSSASFSSSSSSLAPFSNVLLSQGRLTGPIPTFGDGSRATTTTSTSLFASTVLPPPAHHMDWLRLQDEQERLHSRRKPHDRYTATADSTFTSSSSSSRSSSSPLSAKEAWAACFTTVEGLRETFGRNRNPVWGDLDASTTRRLYKTLLPRALLELYHCHSVKSEDLAPLAYRARVAAKKYARERSVLPSRVAASVFDGFRQFCKYGTFQATGMSYRQLWDKYATQIMEEAEDEENFESLEQEDLTSRICYRIIQKSCETNKGIDSLFLPSSQSHQQQQQQARDLQDITRKLEQDVYELLGSSSITGGPVSSSAAADHHSTARSAEERRKWAIRRYKILKTLLRIRRQMEGLAYCEEKDDDLAMQAVLEEA